MNNEEVLVRAYDGFFSPWISLVGWVKNEGLGIMESVDKVSSKREAFIIPFVIFRHLP
jgi:hypothetical protein